MQRPRPGARPRRAGKRRTGGPLYRKVREALLERIRSGAWQPGALIPNEFEIAAEFSVSQGTARKAIDTLAAEQLVRRHQGRGTFVVEHTPQNVLFRFFNFFDIDGRQITPDSRSVRHTTDAATADEARALALKSRAKVIRIDRLRTRGDRVFVVERIVLPAALFARLMRRKVIPNTLYDLFQREFGVLIARTEERVTAVAARRREAKALGIEQGSPLLRVDRIAFTPEGRPIEWRVSLCHLDGAYYVAGTK